MLLFALIVEFLGVTNLCLCVLLQRPCSGWYGDLPTSHARRVEAQSIAGRNERRGKQVGGGATFLNEGHFFLTGHECGSSDGSGDYSDPHGVGRGRVRVTLVVPPPPVAKEERREAGLPVSLGGGAHGLPDWLELEGADA